MPQIWRCISHVVPIPGPINGAGVFNVAKYIILIECLGITGGYWYCWWKKSCTGAGIFDNTVWLLPPHPLFNVVFSSIARWCRISVIQLLCFCDKYFLPMLNGEHEGQGSKCVWWCRIFSINRLQKSCRLVFWLSCSVAWNACRMCMYACLHVWMDVCMYVRTYFLKCSYVLD